MISILNAIAMMDGHLGCKCHVATTKQAELDALEPLHEGGKVWEDGKNPTWEQVLAKKAELEKTDTTA